MKKPSFSSCAQGISPQDWQEIDDLLALLKCESRFQLGYPFTKDFDYSPLFPFLRYSVNNAGDPFVPGISLKLHSRAFEAEVLAWFAKLFRFPWDKTWGYVTGGGTEGNLYGLYLARELHPDGIVYYSRDTHYSVPKNLRLLRMPGIPIESQSNGEVDYRNLHENVHRHIPAIVFANIGTTMKEAVDRVERIRNILSDLSVSASYIHADAALSGMTLPFIDDSPSFDFQSGIDSISVSGHKFIGSPIPCGIVLAKRENVSNVTRPIEYIDTLDATLSGSRNGITPLFLWYAIHKYGRQGFRTKVRQCLDRAEYAVTGLRKVGCKAWRNPHAITVVIPRPPSSIVRKWQIAVNGEDAHIIIMPGVTTELIDEFIADMREDHG
uniref:L-histidine carboxy-lyase (Histamine-forming) n=1 Tax=Candidatus Kentrum sp. FW TaxID=2126338 RepID=A0A450S8F5_9GAMM|nr:MAG: L-histidine carboxy-lyase (histamine-forming) [Candidatus Kentron sp. FW]